MIKLVQDEKILFIARKHWFVFVKEALVLFFLLCAPFLIILVFKFLNIKYDIKIHGDVMILFVFLSSIFLLFIWVSVFIVWTDYCLDILIITNMRIVEVEQKGFFSRELSTFRLENIQDITAESNGIIQTFLEFGIIHIQTAGEDRDFIMHGVSKPFELKNFISQLQDTAAEEPMIVKIAQ